MKSLLEKQVKLPLRHCEERAKRVTKQSPYGEASHSRKEESNHVAIHNPQPHIPQTKIRLGQVRILHETKKAIFVYNGQKIWIPKSQILRIRLRRNVFEVYVKEGLVG